MVIIPIGMNTGGEGSAANATLLLSVLIVPLLGVGLSQAFPFTQNIKWSCLGDACVL